MSDPSALGPATSKTPATGRHCSHAGGAAVKTGHEVRSTAAAPARYFNGVVEKLLE
jgi:hypothetical protein